MSFCFERTSHEIVDGGKSLLSKQQSNLPHPDILHPRFLNSRDRRRHRGVNTDHGHSICHFDALPSDSGHNCHPESIQYGATTNDAEDDYETMDVLVRGGCSLSFNDNGDGDDNHSVDYNDSYAGAVEQCVSGALVLRTKCKLGNSP